MLDVATAAHRGDPPALAENHLRVDDQSVDSALQSINQKLDGVLNKHAASAKAAAAAGLREAVPTAPAEKMLDAKNKTKSSGEAPIMSEPKWTKQGRDDPRKAPPGGGKNTSEYAKQEDDMLRSLALPGRTPMLMSPFKCEHLERRGTCHKGDTEHACWRGQVCDFNQWKGHNTGDLGGLLPCCVKLAMFELLLWFHNVVGDVDIHGNGFWYAIVSGTLLGAQRDKDLIDWDTDIDVAIPIKYKDWLFKRLSEFADRMDPDYMFKVIPSENIADTRRFNLQYHGTVMDIMFVHSFHEDHKKETVVYPEAKGDGRYELSHTDVPNETAWEDADETRPPCVKAYEDAFPGKWLFPLKQCELQGRFFPCIQESEKLLEQVYGSGWRHEGNYTPASSLSPECKAPKFTLLEDAEVSRNDHSRA